MENNLNYTAMSMNDIIFSGRNKDYGAYELRESYNKRIKQSLFGALFLTAFLCSYQRLLALYHPTVPKADIEIVAKMSDPITIDKPPVEAVKPPTPPTPPTPEQPRGTSDPSTMTNATLVSSANAGAVDSVPTNADLADAVISDHTSTGTTAGATKGTPEGTDLTMTVTAPAPVSTAPVSWAEVMPEYPGGERAMLAFIGSGIRYPDMDREMGTQGKVVVGFIVNEDGSISDVRVIKGLSRSLDAESVRIVSTLKRFKPGSQSGHPVKVRFNLPISYHLNQD